MNTPRTPGPRPAPEAVRSGTPDPVVRPGCRGRKKDGDPCGASVTAESGLIFCPWHDPQHSAEERRTWAKRGALSSTARALANRIAAHTPELAQKLEKVAPDLGPPPSLRTAPAIAEYVEKVCQKAEHGFLNPATVLAIKGMVDSAIRLGELAVEREMLELELAAAREDDGVRRGVRFGH
jgi:hypothetical protein